MSSRPRKKARVSLADALANGSEPATILQLLAEDPASTRRADAFGLQPLHIAVSRKVLCILCSPFAFAIILTHLCRCKIA
jgi:hypothetical protein